MRGKHLYKKILAALLILSISFPNVSVAAQPTDAQPPEETTIEQGETVDEAEPAALTEEEPTQEDAAPSDETETPPADNAGEVTEDIITPPTEDVQTDNGNENVTNPDANTDPSATTPEEGENPSQPETPPEEVTNPDQPVTPPAEGGDSNADPEQPVTTPTEDNNSGTNPEQPTTTLEEGENPGTNPEQPVTTPAEDNNSGTDSGQPTPPAEEDSSDQDHNTTITTPAADENTDPDIVDDITNDDISADEIQQPDEEELDLEGQMTEEELDALPEDVVGMAMFRMSRAVVKNTEQPWTFSVKYVNQDKPNNVTVQEKFNLKYQMAFSATETTIEEGKVRIRIPQSLVKTRDEQSINPAQIAVPEAKEGGTNNTIFRYRVITEGVEEPMLEFYNCRSIPIGTNVLWQVLYKDVDVMKIEDLKEWSLQPTITVEIKKEEEETEGEEPDYDIQEQDVQPLRGLVDTYVRINSSAKNAYYEPYKKYTPGLYTKNQIEAYLDQPLPADYANNNFENYRFVVWEIEVKGNATEPWKLELKEDPFFTNADGERIEGKIVGFKNHLDANKGFNLPILGADERTRDSDGTWILTGEQKSYDSWGSRFYVVAAYPETGIVPKETKLENNAVVIMQPTDVSGDPANNELNSGWTYQDYAWRYTGDILYLEKKYTDVEKEKTYDGWLDAYQAAKKQNEDYGEFPFTTRSSLKGYSWTHTTKPEEGEVGVRKPDKEFKLITVDDFMYAYPDLGEGAAGVAKNPLLLDGDDYYFTEVNIDLWDRDYDPYEDQYVSPEETGDLVISMWCDNEDGWKTVDTLSMVEAGKEGYINKIYTLSDIEAKTNGKPWRVKAEYQGSNHTIECQIRVKVCIKYNSPTMQQILEMERTDFDHPENNVTLKTVRLEDLSGAWGEFYDEDELHHMARPSETTDPTLSGNSVDKTEPSNTESEVKSESASGKTLLNYEAYSTTKLSETTKTLYGALIYRDKDDKKLLKLTPHAASYKNSVSINDSANSRVLVDYRLTAYDGYDVYSQEMVDYLKATKWIDSPGQNHVVFYDLLPYAMKYDPSVPAVAGRIVNLDSRGNYQNNPSLWDKAQVRVVVDPDEDVKENYRGTGRTLVAFHIHYDGGDPAVYTNKRWIEGWGVSFRAYYDRKDLDIAQSGKNISAFMSGETNKKLIGKKGEQVFPDDGKSYPNKDYEFFGKINPASDESLCTVLYAEHTAKEDIAVDAETGIKKRVRADNDRFGNFSKSTNVALNGNYTYEISISNAGNGGDSEENIKPIKDIVVYDLLEREEISQWRGTFKSVVVSGLKEAGINPVVYYSIKENVERPENIAALKGSDDWNTSIDPEDVSKVTAIAVDMSKTDKGEDFELSALQSVSFQIRMQAAAEEDLVGKAAVNHASYDANYADGTGIPLEAKDSEPTSVTLRQEATLKVIKKLADNVPESVQDNEFEFEIVKDNGEKLANREYTLWKADASAASGWSQIETERVHATDGSGRFILHANEMAEFSLTGQTNAENVSLSEVSVEEVQSIFWNPIAEDQTTKAEGQNPTRTITVTNHYCPILYVQKLLQGVLNEEDENQEFVFKIETKEGENWKALAGKDFYYVDRTGLAGGIPGPGKENSWEQSKGTTDNQGQFRIRQGELVALAFDTVGTEYRVSEVTETTEENWVCRTEAQEGEVKIGNPVLSITNSYRWKELYLTKKITHQDEEDYKDVEFTFQLWRVTEQGTQKLSSEEMARIKWQLLDKDQKPEGNGQSLIGEGKLTFAAGRTVCIQGLEAGVTYKVTEDPTEDYKASVLNQNGITVTMPEYGTRKDITYTNDYLWRPLSVTKTVVYDPQNPEEVEKVKNTFFHMVASVQDIAGEYTVLANKEYTLMEGGKEVTSVSGNSLSGNSLKTDPFGKFSLKNGQTAVFRNAGKKDMFYEVSEVNDPKTGFEQIYPPNNGTETGVFGDEGAEASFINGSNSGLYIRKEYVYQEGDEAAEKYVKGNEQEGNIRDPGMAEETTRSSEAEVPQMYSMRMVTSNLQGDLSIQGGTKIKPASSVDVTLTLNGQLFNEFCEVTLIDNKSGELYKDIWPGNKDDSLDGIYQLPPGYTVVIPSSVLDNYKDANGNISYELKEQPYDQHRIENYALETGEHQYLEYILEINQKTPADDGSVKGTVKDNPVATVINEVRSYLPTKMVKKSMTDDSYEVPTDAKLVWKVERYAGGEWVPAKEISYVTLIAKESPTYSQVIQRPQMPPDSTDDIYMEDYPKTESPYTCNQILTTDSDGKIVLRKPEKGMPAVQFLNEDVFVNLNKGANEGDLRVIEVPEESDTAWGMLAGYIYGNSDWRLLASLEVPKIQRRMTVQHNLAGLYGESFYSLSVGEDLPEEDRLNPKYIHATGFCNSNYLMPIEISKEMSTGATGPFTMVLEQVLLLKKDEGKTYAKSLENAKAEDIWMSKGYAGIPYTVYNVGSTTPIREGKTEAGGEIRLYAGEYAVVNLPEETLWTVHEKNSANYQLEDLKFESDSKRMKELDDHTLLFYQTPRRYPTALRIQQLEDSVGILDLLNPNAPVPDFDQAAPVYFNPMKRHIKVFGQYSDGTEKELTQNEVIYSWEGLRIPGEFDSTNDQMLTYNIRWRGKLVSTQYMFSYKTQPEICLTEELITRGVFDWNGNPVNLTSNGVMVPSYIRTENGGELYRVTKIGEEEECVFGEGITYIEIPSSVTEISSKAFEKCSLLQGITLEKELDSISGCPWGASTNPTIRWRLSQGDMMP